LKGFPLRMAEAERAEVERIQAAAVEAGLTDVSLNDVIRHLIRRVSIPRGRTSAECMSELKEHAIVCPDCEPARPPRCLDGLYLRELNAAAWNAERGPLAVDRR